MNQGANVQLVSIELIIPNRFQPRLTFDETSLNELAESIKEHGIIQPLVLRRLADKYEIIAGERRYKAAMIAGLTEVPAIIANLDDNQSAEVALVENVQRRDLSAIEEAKSYQKILDKSQLTQEQLAKKIGVSQPAIANKLRLLTLAEKVQEALMYEKISERHARSLLHLTEHTNQVNLLQRIVDERLTVRQLDLEIKKIIDLSIEDSPVTMLVDNKTSTVPPSSEDLPSSIKTEDLIVEPSTEEVPANNPLVLESTPESNPVLEEKEETVDETVSAATILDEIKVDAMPEEPINPASNDQIDSQDSVSMPKEDNNPDTTSDSSAVVDPDTEAIQANATDILSLAANKMFGGFDQVQRPSLEDEAVNMNVDFSQPAFNPFETAEDVELNPMDEDLETPAQASASETPLPEPKEPEKRIKAESLPSVSDAYKSLEEEVREAGYKISTEEFDFEDLYQIIIKIDKQAE